MNCACRWRVETGGPIARAHVRAGLLDRSGFGAGAHPPTGQGVHSVPPRPME